MRNILKYIPIHMEDDFLEYVLDVYNMSKDEIEVSDRIEYIAGKYLFKKNSKEEKHEVEEKVKSEDDIFGGICNSKFGAVSWERVTEITHSKVRIADSVIPVYALEVMYGDELYKRIVMRDYEKSLRFMKYVFNVWINPGEQIY